MLMRHFFCVLGNCLKDRLSARVCGRLGAVLLLALSVAAWANSMPVEGVDPGDVVPDIGGLALNGKPSRLSALRGKVVIVDFWASYCGPCVLAMPELERLRKDIQAMGWGDRFEILGVGMDQDMDKARAFLKQYPVTYPIISDMLGIASKLYGVWRLPATYILDTDGRAMMIYHGYGDEFGPDMRMRTLELLRKTGPPSVTP